MSDAAERVVELVDLLARSVVPESRSGELRISHRIVKEGTGGTVVYVEIEGPEEPEMIGRVMGRSGQTIGAIQRIANASAARNGLFARVSVLHG